MKFTIHGLQQQGLIDLDLDHTDALLLRFFLDFKAEGRMHEIIVNDETFYWLNYKNIANQLPIINNSNRTIAKRFRRYEELGIIKKVIEPTSSGKKAYLNITPFFTKKLSEYQKNSQVHEKELGSKHAKCVSSHVDEKALGQVPQKALAIYNSSHQDYSSHQNKKINQKNLGMRKKRKVSETKKIQQNQKQTFIQKIKDIYPKHKTDKEGFRRLEKFYDTKILKDNSEQTKLSEQSFIKNLECCLKFNPDEKYMFILKNYVGTDSKNSKNYYEENWIEKLESKQASEKKSQNVLSRKNPQHHFCEQKAGSAAKQMDEEDRIAKKLWEEKGIATPGIVFEN